MACLPARIAIHYDILHSWPIIERELRVQSRRPRTFWLRWLGAAALLVGTLVLLYDPTSTEYVTVILPDGTPTMEVRSIEGWERWDRSLNRYETHGGTLLAAMNAVALLGIWLLAPFLTADCLSSERREGTLGILLLTPARARNVVIAKLMAYGWEALCLLLAALPLLTIAILMGGVSATDTLGTACMDLSAVLLALAAGLLASSLWEGPREVLLGAVLIAIGFATLLHFTWAFTLMLVNTGLLGAAPAPTIITTLGSSPAPAPPPSPLPTSAPPELGALWNLAVQNVLNPRDLLESLANPGTVGVTRVAPALIGLGVAVALTLGVAGWATFRVRRFAGTGTSGARTLPARTLPAAAKERAWTQGRRRTLEWLRLRNPFLWAELRTWRGHVIPGLSLGLIFPWEIWRATAGWGYDAVLGGIDWVLAGVVAFAAAACFQDERRQGNFEYLLTVPKGARRLVVGKGVGLFLQALPALILLGGIEAATLSNTVDGNWPWPVAIRWTAALLLMLLGRTVLAMAAGMWFGLRLPALFPAWLATVLTLIVTEWASGLLPLREGLGAETSSSQLWTYYGSAVSWTSTGLVQLQLALLALLATYATLTARRPMR